MEPSLYRETNFIDCYRNRRHWRSVHSFQVLVARMISERVIGPEMPVVAFVIRDGEGM